jgi:hypothetical protein
MSTTSNGLIAEKEYAYIQQRSQILERKKKRKKKQEQKRKTYGKMS